MKAKTLAFSSDQSGSVAVIAALAMVVLLGMAAMTLDVGHLLTVKTEMQRSVDAGALAGARALVPYNTTSIPPQPNWAQGQIVATQTFEKNKGDGQLLTDCQVQDGYWNTATKVLQSTGISPGANDVPAILVTASKTAGKNGGPVQMFLATVMGIDTAEVSAKGLAFISSVSGIPKKGGGFPLAVPQVLVDEYWYLSTPVSFKIGSTYHDPEGGQWTSLLTDANDVPTIRSLMANGNPDPLKIGDNIWIQPGTKNTLYGNAAAYVGKTFVLPVVTTDFSTHSYTPILGFVSFYIEATHQGSGPYVQGHFVKDAPITNGTPGGPYNGTFIPPKMPYY